MAIRFEDLSVWQRARQLTSEVYAISRRPGFADDHGLRNQIRRAAVSVMSNIAEGFERRRSPAEFARFLSMAKGSCGEVRSQLYVAEDQRYVAPTDCGRLIGKACEVSRMIEGLSRTVRAQSHR